VSDDQDTEMRELLRKLELISHAATQAWNASGGQSGEPDDRFVAVVARGDDPPHLTLRRRYNGCKTNPARDAVLKDARREFELLCKPRDWQKLKDMPSITVDQIVVVDGEGWSPTDLAQAQRMTPTQIRRIRAKANLDVETGKALVTTALDRAEKVARARELNDKGLSLRQIGMHIGVGAETVRRYVSGPSADTVE
jgi:hypothetical protein